MKLHEPYEKLTRYQVKRARQHAKLHRPGTIPEKELKHRVRLDMGKVDHFCEFANRPYFHQDVAYGSRILKLQYGSNYFATPPLPHSMLTKSVFYSRTELVLSEETTLKRGRGRGISSVETVSWFVAEIVDSGEKIPMPNVVRTAMRSTMVKQYQSFCEEEGFNHLSRSTLFNILNVREASHRRRDAYFHCNLYTVSLCNCDMFLHFQPV